MEELTNFTGSRLLRSAADYAENGYLIQRISQGNYRQSLRSSLH
jgi:hypothetical protein